MSHPAALIQKIAALLRTDYDPARYRYVIEQAIPGTRMYPDIQIREIDSGRIVCAVEVGYTRPEKLTAYRAVHLIPDVRWYAKDGTLHTAALDVRAVLARVMLEPAGDVAVYTLDNIAWTRRTPHSVGCPDCFDEEMAEPADDEEDEEQPSEVRRSQESEEFFESALDWACADVILWIITDYLRAFAVVYCDKCGLTRRLDADEDVCLWALFEDVKHFPPVELGRAWGARELMPWATLTQRLHEQYDIELRYADGYPVADGRPVDAQVRALASQVLETA